MEFRELQDQMEGMTYAMHNTGTVRWRSWADNYLALQHFAKTKKLMPQQFQGKNQKKVL